MKTKTTAAQRHVPMDSLHHHRGARIGADGATGARGADAACGPADRGKSRRQAEHLLHARRLREHAAQLHPGLCRQYRGDNCRHQNCAGGHHRHGDGGEHRAAGYRRLANARRVHPARVQRRIPDHGHQRHHVHHYGCSDGGDAFQCRKLHCQSPLLPWRLEHRRVLGGSPEQHRELEQPAVLHRRFQPHDVQPVGDVHPATQMGRVAVHRRDPVHRHQHRRQWQSGQRRGEFRFGPA